MNEVSKIKARQLKKVSKVWHFGRLGQYFPDEKIVVIAAQDCCGQCESEYHGCTHLYLNVDIDELPLFFPKNDFILSYHNYGLLTAQEKADLELFNSEKSVKKLQRRLETAQRTLKTKKSLAATMKKM